MADAPQPRTRRRHSRSRAGCLECRSRHMRCDEGKPACLNCLAGRRSCKYPPPALPLRERRARAQLPGTQDVWVVAPSRHDDDDDEDDDARASAAATKPSHRLPPLHLPPSAAKKDPFDSLAVSMPLESLGLVQYFYNSAATLGKPIRKDCLATTLGDPASSRCIIMLAGLHFAWNVGSLVYYEPTFVFHKLQSIRFINQRLLDTGTRDVLDCAKQITTISLTEVCLGNIPVAESHLQGLLKMLELNSSALDNCGRHESLDKELLDRYLILASGFIQSFKSRLYTENMNQAGGDHSSSAPVEPPGDMLSDPMRSHHLQEEMGIPMRLMAFRLMPHFFAPPAADTTPQPVDILPQLAYLRAVTRTVDRRDCAATAPRQQTRIMASMWKRGLLTRLFHLLVQSHGESITGQPPRTSGLLTTWLGFNAGLSLYMNCVIVIVNIGSSMDHRLFFRILDILGQDLIITGGDLDAADPLRGHLWLWKAFLGFFGVVVAEQGVLKDTSRLREQRERFTACLARWRRSAGGRGDWVSIREALGQIVWPSSPWSEEFSKQVWEAMPPGT